METITEIAEQSIGSGRYAVEVDGVVIGFLGITAIASLGLHVGDTMDVQASDRLRDAIAEQAVFDKGVSMLSVSQRSARELQRRLIQKGAGKLHVEGAIARLTALGYLNDAAYAESLVHSRMVEGGVSKRRVQQDLLRKGVSRSTADKVIQQAVEEHQTDERAAALQLAQKRLKSLTGLDPVVRRRRLYSFLARRGYDPAAISSVMKSLGPALVSNDVSSGSDIDPSPDEDLIGDE